MNTRQKRLYMGLISAAGLSLSACLDSSSAPAEPPVVVPPPPPVAQTPQEKAGAGFAIAFNRVPFAQPIDPTENDLNPVDVSAEPIAIPDP